MMGFENFSREAYKLAFGEDQTYKDNLVSVRRGGVLPWQLLIGDLCTLSLLVCYCSDNFWDWILEAWRNVHG